MDFAKWRLGQVTSASHQIPPVETELTRKLQMLQFSMDVIWPLQDLDCAFELTTLHF